MKKLLEYRNCFVCGKESRNGLKLDFEVTEKGARTFYTPDDDYEGFKGIVHGGVLCALLDEIMWKAVNGRTGAVTVTVKLEVRFKRPAVIGTTLSVEGELTGSRKKLYETRAVIGDPEGNIIAEATGLFMELAEADTARMVENLS